MEIKKITDPAFRKYGENPDRDRFYGVSRSRCQKTPCPDNVIYEPSIAELEALPVYGGAAESLLRRAADSGRLLQRLQLKS